MMNNKKPFDPINELVLRLKLILRLMKDKRVSFGLKLIPIFLALYFPIPDFLPGPLDDLLVIALGLILFVEFSPKELVEEHMNELRNVIPGEWKESGKKEDVIEGEVKDIPEPSPKDAKVKTSKRSSK